MMMRYVGEGNFLIGVPARDLTVAEADEHGGVELLTASGLYVLDDEEHEEPIEPIEEVLLSQVIDLAEVERHFIETAGRDLRKRRTG